MGCMLIVVGVTAGFAAADDGRPAPVRWAGLGLVVLCLILGTILELKDKLDL